VEKKGSCTGEGRRGVREGGGKVQLSTQHKEKSKCPITRRKGGNIDIKINVKKRRVSVCGENKEGKKV